MRENENIRTFLAIDPPAVILENIAGMQNCLKRSIQGAVRWVRSEGIHLTLKFFGAIVAADVEIISEVIAKRTAAVPPFFLEVGGLGAFPDAARPRIIWMGIAGQLASLLSLQKDLEEEFLLLGFSQEDRPFRAHLTVGRVKVPKGIAGLAPAIEGAGNQTATLQGRRGGVVPEPPVAAGGGLHKTGGVSLARIMKPSIKAKFPTFYEFIIN